MGNETGTRVSPLPGTATVVSRTVVRNGGSVASPNRTTCVPRATPPTTARPEPSVVPRPSAIRTSTPDNGRSVPPIAPSRSQSRKTATVALNVSAGGAGGLETGGVGPEGEVL